MNEIMRLKMWRNLVCFILLMNGFSAISQIEMSRESTAKEEKVEKENSQQDGGQR